MKGFNVVKALNEAAILQSIHCVIGKDSGVTNDYSAELIEYCNKHKILYSFRKEAAYEQEEYDLFLAVGWRWLITDIPSKKLVIFHDSLLPKYRGFAPLVNALINKESTTGVTALLGAEEYDRGNILLQRRLDIIYPTTIEQELCRMSMLYAELAVELLVKLNNKAINRAGCPQTEADATYSLWRDEEDYRINWHDYAANIEHFISCVSSPYRGASSLLNGSVVRVLQATAREDMKIENRAPGKVIFIESGMPVVVCGSGLLKLADVRDENDQSVLPLKQFRSRFC